MVETPRYYASIPRIWAQMTVHNTWGILNVFDMVWLRPFPAGRIAADHPFCTGIDPQTSRPIWTSNLVFRAPRRRHFDASDEEIVESVGSHLATLCAQAASSAESPEGRPSRMPPAILYIHGAVHYNGGLLLFDDFAQAIEHFSNEAFRAEFRRFVREEKREPVTIFRDRDYDRREFIEFVCFLRTVLPWFSNSNGNRARIGWGNPSPYPAVNTITGNWIADTRLVGTGGGDRVCRPAIDRSRYFQDAYAPGSRTKATLPERLLATFTERRVEARGARGNLFFVDLRKLRRGRRFYSRSMMGPLGRWWMRLRGPNGRFAPNDYHFGIDS